MGIPLATQAKRVIIPVGGEFDSAGGDEPTAPDAPSAPSLTVGDTQLSASWAAVSGATTYDVIYNTSDSTSGATAFSGNPVSGTSAVITDLTNDTAYYVFVRATNAVGSSAYSASATATPAAAAEGEYTLIGGVFTLTAPSGVDFGVKPYAAKPWLVWIADDGLEPNATLGRQTAWSGTSDVNAEISTAILAPGATQSARLDHGANSGAMLSEVSLPHEPDSIVWGRGVYDDFTENEAIACRIRYSALTGLVAADLPDKWFKGRTTGATGRINRLGTGSGAAHVFMYTDVGTIALPDIYPRPLGRPDVENPFNNSEIMDIYDNSDTEFTTSLGTAINSEGSSGAVGTGVFYTFNNKITRIWNQAKTTYMYHSTNPTRITAYGGPFRGTLDGGSPDSDFYEYVIAHDYFVRNWVQEVFVYRHSTLNNYDGKRYWYCNELVLFEDIDWNMRTTALPDKQSKVYQSQISNGCEPNSFKYMSYLIVDDSEYQVYLINDDGQKQMLPPITWNPSSNGIITAAELPLLPDWTSIQVWINQTPVAIYPRVV